MIDQTEQITLTIFNCSKKEPIVASLPCDENLHVSQSHDGLYTKPLLIPDFRPEVEKLDSKIILYAVI